MLRWISKSGTFIQFTVFAVILIAIWIPAFVNPLLPVNTPSDGPLYTLLVSWLQYSPSLAVAVALILVVLQSVVLFYVYQSNGFFGRSNFLPAIIALLAFSWNGNYQTMHAILPAGIFIIIALNVIMVMYGRQAAYHEVFSAAFSIGIASLFYIPLAYLLLVVWLSLITYRVSSWREYVITIIGFSMPYLYYISWLFWTDCLSSGLRHLATSLFNFMLPPQLSMVYSIWLSASVFLMIVAMIAVLNIMSDKLISLRRRAWILFNFSFTAVIVIFLAGWHILSTNYLFVVPMSFFITGSLTLIKRSFWFEVLALGYFLLFVVMRVYLVI